MGRRKAAVSCVLLLAAYVGLSFLNSPKGFLGTDTGGKVATLRVMAGQVDGRPRLDPDLGYWAQQWDPDGRVYPLAFTTHVAHGWVNVTTLPALFAALPLYRLWGYRGALLVPMLGSILAALAAVALVRRLRPDGPTWLPAAAFWLVGLASPLTVYALDFWEHSLGVAAMAWSVVLVVDALTLVPSRRVAVRTAGAGVLLGVAATMRTETLVYAFITGLVLGAVMLWRRASLISIGLAGLALVIGFAVPVALNQRLERRVIGASLRAPRAAGTAVAAGSQSNTRLEEAGITTVGLDGSASGIALGLTLAAVLVVAALRGASDLRFAGVALGLAGVLYLIRFAGGLSFVPGLVAATPLAALAIRARWSPPVAIALGAVPLVLAFQFTGGAGPQWAGRYLLVSGFLLGVTGIAALATVGRPVAIGFCALAAVVTVFGVAWLSVRSHDVARTMTALDRRPEDVLVSSVPHLVREGGAFYGDRKWLTAEDQASRGVAAHVIAGSGARSAALVEYADARHGSLPGFTEIGRSRVRLFDDVDLRVTSWRR